MKILVFGDSIAYGKWDEKGGWVARLREYVDKNYYIGKGRNHQVYNLGIPGEVAVRMVKRVEDELKNRMDELDKEYLILFAIGINDANPSNWMTKEQTPKIAFKVVVQELVNIVQTYKVKVACIGLTPINENGWLPGSKFRGSFFNHHVKEYDNYLSNSCGELKIPKLSFYDELITEKYVNLLVDGIHPNSKGHEMLFNKILKFLEINKLLPR